MAASYNYDVPKDAPKSRPVDQAPSGHHSHADAIGELPVANVSAEAAGPLRASRGRAAAHRGSSTGRFLRPGYADEVDVVSGCHLPGQKSFYMLHHPDGGRDWRTPPPDYSQGPSIAEGLAMSVGHPCPGDARCQVCVPQAFFNQIQEFGQ